MILGFLICRNPRFVLGLFVFNVCTYLIYLLTATNMVIDTSQKWREREGEGEREGGGSEGERGGKREREREREKERERERDTGRQAGRQTDRQAGTNTLRERERSYRQTGGQTVFGKATHIGDIH